MTSRGPTGELSTEFRALRIRNVIVETSEARSFVLDIPDDLRDEFRYRAGQFCSFRVPVDGQPLVRCYSMSSSPDTDPEFKVTVKRVPGGPVSNWMIDHLSEGDVLEVTPPAGRFCLRTDEARRARPLVGFCGGSGITPVISLLKTLLATTERRASLLYANRDPESILFFEELAALACAHGERLRIVHRLDAERGFVDRIAVAEFVGDERDADFYLCGPGPFLDVVEGGLLDLAVAVDRIFIERFAFAEEAAAPSAEDGDAADGVAPETVTIVLRGRQYAVAYHRGDTILETARRGGLRAPSSCESGICGTCLGRLRVGAARMKHNDVLTPDEVAAGLVLTCQGVPTTRTVTVVYED